MKPSPSESSRIFLCDASLYIPAPFPCNQWSTLRHYGLFLFPRILYKWSHTECPVWLSLGIIILKLIHMVPWISRSFLLVVEWYPQSESESRSATPWTIQSMEFSRPEYWSGQPLPSPGDLPNPGIKPRSPTLQTDSLPAEPQGKPKNTGVGSLSLLQWIFPTQESNWGLLHCRWILYQLSYQGSPQVRF